MSRPTLIFVAGAWHTPSCYSLVIPPLRSLGYKCLAPAMPSVGRSPPVESLDEDIGVIRDAVLSECEAGRDVVVVCHSGGGIAVSCALEGMGIAEGEVNRGAGRVIKIAYLAAFMSPVGVSVIDAVGGTPPPFWKFHDDGTITVIDPIPIFYHDLDPNLASSYAACLEPNAKATFYAKATGAAWRTIPSVYLICEDDRCFPTFAQVGLVKTIQESGSPMTVERVMTSHSPFYAKPDFIVEFVRRAAGESI